MIFLKYKNKFILSYTAFLILSICLKKIDIWYISYYSNCFNPLNPFHFEFKKGEEKLMRSSKSFSFWGKSQSLSEIVSGVWNQLIFKTFSWWNPFRKWFKVWSFKTGDTTSFLHYLNHYQEIFWYLFGVSCIIEHYRVWHHWNMP